MQSVSNSNAKHNTLLMSIEEEDEEEEKYNHNQRIELQIYKQNHSKSFVLLETKSAIDSYPINVQDDEKYFVNNQQHENVDQHIPFELQYIEYSLNNVKKEITAKTKCPQTHSTQNRISLYCKYRKEIIMHHRQKRYNMVLVPIYVIFIIFCYFVFLSVNDTMSINKISYIDPTNIEFRDSIIERCNIPIDDIYGWFDGSSFDVNQKKWVDLSVYSNDISSSNIINNIKIG
eukprot:514558_1